MASDRRDAPGAAPATSIADRYVLEDLLARGGMGSVYKARDEVLARAVAVKILHPHLSEDETFLARFRREAVAAAGLAHPGIVAIYDTGADLSEDGVERHYIVMEHCAGGTLTDLIAGQGAFAPDRAAEVAAAMCESLDFAHRAGVVHRDVKPDNVLFSDDGTLKVADFGIAKAAYASGDITTTGSILGTVTYVSPEQAAGREPDARSDVYSAGVVLYELLVGRPPFRGETDVATAMMHLKEPPVPVRALKPQVPRRLEAAVARALAKDPADRWSSAEEMARALHSGRDATVVVPRVPVTPREEPVDEPARDPNWIGPVVALILFGLLLAFVVPRLLDDTGERSQGRTGGRRGAGVDAGGRLAIAGVVSFDPDGDGDEHSEDAALAIDGDPATAWGAESYEDSLAVFGKSGIGLVLDLGSAQEVAAVEVTTPTPGFALEIRASETPPAAADDAELVTSVDEAGTVEELTFDAVEGRYWLLWITELPGSGGGTVEIGEVTIRGSG